MKTFFRILKSALKSLTIWVGLTIVALSVDSALNLSDKSEIFTFLFITVPLVTAVWSPSKKLILLAFEHEKSKQKKQPKQMAQQPASQTIKPALKQSSPTQRIGYTMARIDKMDGHDFEQFTANLLRKLGYERVEVTPGSGDQGVDVIAVKDGKRYAIQCKRYAQKLGNKPVQEVFAGKTIYGCSVAVVLTNNYFTEGAKEAAKATGVELWDRDTLRRMIDYANYKAIV